MKSVVVIAVFSLATISGCQYEFQETQYNDLQVNNLEITVDQRSLEGPLFDHWESNVEPMVQTLCVQCHGEGDPLSTGLEFNNDQMGNLVSALEVVRQNNHLPLSDNTHGQLDEEQQHALTTFEEMARAYWPWHEQLELLKSQTWAFYTRHIENQIVQPACSLCHQEPNDQHPNPQLNLSFYPHTRINHEQLNAEYSLEYLLIREDPYLLYNKATNLTYHGGGATIQINTDFSDNLQMHGQNVEKIITTLKQPPF